LDRIALVGHGRRALLADRERLLDLAHLGSLQVPNLDRELLDRASQQRHRSKELGVAIALDDLRAGRVRP
jgi:hypothetical protein